MAQQLLKIGDTIGELEVTAVSYQERQDSEGNTEKFNFEYHLMHPGDIVRPEAEEATEPAPEEPASKEEV